MSLSEQYDFFYGKSVAINRLKVTQTLWVRYMESTDFTNTKYFNIFIIGTYWVSTRCVECSKRNTLGNADFRIRRVSNGYVGGCTMLHSHDENSYDSIGIRPVVLLSSNVQLSGDSTNGWTIQ